MNYVRCCTTCILLVAISLAFSGCKSKEEKPAALQEKTALPADVIPEDKPGAPAIPPQDKADAQAAALQVLALLESGDFPVFIILSLAFFLF